MPGAPTGLTATPGDQQVDLTWTAPASNGGSAITGYAVEYRPEGSSTWASFSAGTTTSATVTGLTNGTTYDLRLTATNTVGAGAASAMATATPSAAVSPAQAPDAPTGLAATPGEQQVALAWTAPSDNGGSPITGYTVEYRTSGGSWMTYVGGDGAVTSVTITGLADSTTYEFRVRASNAIGLGAASSVATATTADAAPGLTGTGFDAAMSLGFVLLLIALGLTATLVASRRRSTRRELAQSAD